MKNRNLHSTMAQIKFNQPTQWQRLFQIYIPLWLRLNTRVEQIDNQFSQYLHSTMAQIKSEKGINIPFSYINLHSTMAQIKFHRKQINKATVDHLHSTMAQIKFLSCDCNPFSSTIIYIPLWLRLNVNPPLIYKISFLFTFHYGLD